MSSDDTKRFLGTLQRTKNLKRSLQSLYNSDKTPEELQAIIDESSQVLPDLKGTGIFQHYKKTKREMHKKPISIKNIENLKEMENYARILRDIGGN